MTKGNWFVDVIEIESNQVDRTITRKTELEAEDAERKILLTLDTAKYRTVISSLVM